MGTGNGNGEIAPVDRSRQRDRSGWGGLFQEPPASAESASQPVITVASMELPMPAGGNVVRLDTPLLTPAEAAALLAVKPSWIYEAVRSGALPCLRIGRHIRFTRAMLEDWLQSRAA